MAELARSKMRYAADPEKQRNRLAAWEAANPERMKTIREEYKRRNADKLLSDVRAYRQKTREHRNEYNRLWRKKNEVHYRVLVLFRNRKNAGTINATTARRAAAKKQAIPRWADLDEIREFYEASRWMSENTNEAWEVDHIVPLQSKVVCGLHCPANLQIISRTENRRKCNRYWPDMW